MSLNGGGGGGDGGGGGWKVVTKKKPATKATTTKIAWQLEYSRVYHKTKQAYINQCQAEGKACNPGRLKACISTAIAKAKARFR